MLSNDRHDHVAVGRNPILINRYEPVCIAIERNRLWKLDFAVPKKYGIRHTLGENGFGMLDEPSQFFEIVRP